MKMKVSDYIVDFLSQKGVSRIFGYAGGAITHIIDSLHGRKDISFVSTYHEQAAAFAAEGYARIKNDIGVAMATSGPGATNLITGIGSAFFDSIPCLYITGQVNTYEYKGRSKVRQKGFQELEIVNVVRPITKYSKRIIDPGTIKIELEKACDIAMSGRKGPVLLDIPMNIQRAEIDAADLVGYKRMAEAGDDSKNRRVMAKIIKMLRSSKRPVVLVGGGVRNAGATEELEVFLKKTKIPFVSTLMGLDACEPALRNYCGFIGAYGNRCGNYTLANSDLIISVGSRLDTRQTGTDLKLFAREAKIVRIDIDKDELSNSIKKDEVKVHSDAGKFMAALNKYCRPLDIKASASWTSITQGYKSKYMSEKSDEIMNPNVIIEKISGLCKINDIICLDVGQNQMWAAQSFRKKRGQRILISGGMGSMGFSLPAAIGAYYASPHSRVIAFSGDGGIQMNIQELELLKRNKIPIKVIIMNNHALGMIRHFQEMYFSEKYEGTIIGYAVPDFVKIAKAYGLKSVTIRKMSEVPKLKKILKNDSSIVINIELGQKTYVHPKLAVNFPIEDQEPLLNREEHYSNMIVKPAK